MDEEIEKPFSIELIVILLIVALANDVAEIFFDLLSATGVGLVGEAIMEPADLILDVFFTGIFWWKIGPGGGTITQYIDDILEPLLIPGRTISVGLGIWIANHPDSAVGKAANTAVSLENGNVVGALAGGAEDAAERVEKEVQGGRASQGGMQESENPKASEEEVSLSTPESQSGNDNGSVPEGGVFENPYDNPVGTAGKEVFNPSEDKIQEPNGIHLVGGRPPAPPKQGQSENVNNEGLSDAA